MRNTRPRSRPGLRRAASESAWRRAYGGLERCKEALRIWFAFLGSGYVQPMRALRARRHAARRRASVRRAGIGGVDVRFGIQDDAWLQYGPGTLATRAATSRPTGVRRRAGNRQLVRGRAHARKLQLAPHRRGAERAASKRARSGRDALGHSPLGERRSGPQPASHRGRGLRGVRSSRRSAVSLRQAVGDLERAEPAPLARPRLARGVLSRLLNPAYRSIKSVAPSAKVAGGVTAPRGNRGGMSPVNFVRLMDRAGALLDAYAHHPYPANPGETPYAGACRGCKNITMASLEVLVREVGRAFPRARIWLTEYGYQTTPIRLGVSPELQANYIAQAARRVYALPKVDMLIHYLYRDEPDLARWQSGLETVDGRAKPALSATMSRSCRCHAVDRRPTCGDRSCPERDDSATRCNSSSADGGSRSAASGRRRRAATSFAGCRHRPVPSFGCGTPRDASRARLSFASP